MSDAEMARRLAGQASARDRRESLFLTTSVLLGTLGLAATVVVAWIQGSWLTVLAGSALSTLTVIAGALTGGLVNHLADRRQAR